MDSPTSERRDEAGDEDGVPDAAKMEDSASTGCCASFRGCLRSITVEPIAVFSILGMATQMVLTSEYIVEVYSQDYVANIANVTAGPDLITAAEDAAAADSATFISTLLLCNIPSIFIAFFIGVYSDRVGRKRIMFVPLAGLCISAVLVFCIIQFELDLNWFYLGVVVMDICGGGTVINTLLHAYIADITTRDNMAIRMLYLRFIEIGAVSVSSLITGILVTYLGFIYAQTFVLVMFVIAVLYGIFVLDDTKAPRSEPKSLFDCVAGVKQLIVMVTSGSARRRLTLAVHSFLIFVDSMFTTGALTVLTLFLLNPPVELGADFVGYYFTEYTLLKIFGTLILVPFYKGKKSDSCWMILALVSGLLGKIFLSVPCYDIIYVFFVPWTGFLVTIIIPFSRASLSQLVGPDEQGSMSAYASMVGQTSIVIGSTLLTYIYAVTYDVYVSTVFCIGAIAYATGLLIFGLLQVTGGAADPQYDARVDDDSSREAGKPSSMSSPLTSHDMKLYGTDTPPK